MLGWIGERTAKVPRWHAITGIILWAVALRLQSRGAGRQRRQIRELTARRTGWRKVQLNATSMGGENHIAVELDRWTVFSFGAWGEKSWALTKNRKVRQG